MCVYRLYDTICIQTLIWYVCVFLFILSIYGRNTYIYTITNPPLIERIERIETHSHMRVIWCVHVKVNTYKHFLVNMYPTSSTSMYKIAGGQGLSPRSGIQGNNRAGCPVLLFFRAIPRVPPILTASSFMYILSVCSTGSPLCISHNWLKDMHI
jgi:hypothetical protein